MGIVDVEGEEEALWTLTISQARVRDSFLLESRWIGNPARQMRKNRGVGRCDILVQDSLAISYE